MTRKLNDWLIYLHRSLAIGLCAFAFYMLITGKGHNNFPFIVAMIPACTINLIFGFVLMKDKNDDAFKG